MLRRSSEPARCHAGCLDEGTILWNTGWYLELHGTQGEALGTGQVDVRPFSLSPCSGLGVSLAVVPGMEVDWPSMRSCLLGFVCLFVWGLVLHAREGKKPSHFHQTEQSLTWQLRVTEYTRGAN